MIKDIDGFYMTSDTYIGNMLPSEGCLVKQLMDGRIWKVQYMFIDGKQHDISFFWKLCFYLRYKFKPCRCQKCLY